MKLRILLFTCFSILIISCEKETALEKYYNQPGNFSGSIYDALDSTGMYTYFLLGVDSTEFKNQLKNTLVTVIAPNDKAFEAYFAKHGYESISSIPKNILEDLIGNHIITWPQAPTSFQLEPIWFKRQSNMAAGTEFKYNQITGTEIEVVKEAKYLQFYFPEMLNEYKGTPNDYYMLTGTDLSPTTGFNVNNVQVETLLPYGNGWVYFVDQVIEPIQNIDDWLMKSSDYSMFNTMFNRFSLYYVDNNVNRLIPVKRSNLFLTNRDFRIDMETSFETVGYIREGDDYISQKGRSNFTVFAPENTALESFVDTYFKDYPYFKENIGVTDKTSVENLHLDKIVRAILRPYMFIDLPIFPSNFFSNDGVTGYDGTNFKFNEQDISEYTLCSNGYGYGLSNFEVPRTFKSILSTAYTSPNYKYFVAAVEAAGIYTYLNTLSANYTLMLPTDEAFLNNGILLLDLDTYNAEYNSSVTNRTGANDMIVYRTDTTNGKVAQRLSTQDLFELVFNHLIETPVTPSSQKQYALNAIGDYVGITQDSVWSGGNIHNLYGTRLTGVPSIIENIAGSSTDNGRVYIIDDLIKTPVLSVGGMIKVNPAFSRFKDLCENAGLYLSDGTLAVYGNTPAVFIPTNDAINQAIIDGLVPSDELALQSFIKYFFVDRTIFTSETISESIPTLSKDEALSTEFKIVYKYAELSGTYEDLKIKGTNNTSFRNVFEGENSNIICTDGIIHLIDGVLY